MRQTSLSRAGFGFVSPTHNRMPNFITAAKVIICSSLMDTWVCTSVSLPWVSPAVQGWRNHLQRGFPGGSVLNNLPAMQEMWARSLGWEDPLEKEMATHSSIIAWETPWTEEPTGVREPQSIGLPRVRHNSATDYTRESSLRPTKGNSYPIWTSEALAGTEKLMMAPATQVGSGGAWSGAQLRPKSLTTLLPVGRLSANWTCQS